MSNTDLKKEIQSKYGKRALSVKEGSAGSECCGDGEAACNPITVDLYDTSEQSQIPESAFLASLGCGNPTALAELQAGRITVSDIVVRGQMPEAIRRSVELWIGCVAGALEESEYKAGLEAAGFEDVSLEPTRVYRVEDARDFLAEQGLEIDAIAGEIDERFMSAAVRAKKPSVS